MNSAVFLWLWKAMCALPQVWCFLKLWLTDFFRTKCDWPGSAVTLAWSCMHCVHAMFQAFHWMKSKFLHVIGLKAEPCHVTTAFKSWAFTVRKKLLYIYYIIIYILPMFAWQMLFEWWQKILVWMNRAFFVWVGKGTADL